MGILDNFNRANGALHSGGGASLWESTAYDGAAGGLSVVTNQLGASIADGGQVSKFTVGPDFDLRLPITVKTAGWVALFAPVINPGASWEGIWLVIDFPSSGNWRFNRRVAGVTTTAFAEGTHPGGSIGNGDVIRFWRVGTRLRAALLDDASPILDVTEPALQVSGRVAIVFNATSTRGDDLEDAYVAPAGAAPVCTVPPTLAGTPTADQTLTRTAGTWTGTPTPTVSARLQRSDDGSTGWSNVGSVNDPNVALTGGDVGKYFSVLETATNSEAPGGVTQRSNVVGPVVVAPPLEFSWRLSGGASNADPAASIGGAESSEHVDGLAIFPPLTAQQAQSGHTDYRWIYLHNADAVGGSAVLFLPEGGAFSGRQYFAVGIAGESAGATVPALANATTAPPGVTFGTGNSPETGQDAGLIPGGTGKGVCIRRSVPPGTPASAPTNAARVRARITPAD